MNILPINNIRFTPLKNNDKNSSISIPQFGLKLSKPLDRDTVSFGATAQKTILVKNCGANRTTTAKAADIAKDLQPSFENFLKKLFKPLLVKNC